MSPEDLKELFALAKEREEKLHAWLRHLIVVASGALTLLVSLRGPEPAGVVAIFLLKATWVTLGGGILLGSVALYSEVWTAREIARKFGEEIRKPYGTRMPVVGTPPRWMLWCERACYVSLSLAVICLVSFGVAT